MDLFGIRLYAKQTFLKCKTWLNTPLNISYTNLDRMLDTIQAIAIIVLAAALYLK